MLKWMPSSISSACVIEKMAAIWWQVGATAIAGLLATLIFRV
jgi:hypothetical protein